jgi:hypothetical protein
MFCLSQRVLAGRKRQKCKKEKFNTTENVHFDRCPALSRVMQNSGTTLSLEL